MPRYTDRDRRKSIATRRRNARLHRAQIAKLGYNPNNPTVKLTDNIVVTQAVEKRLAKKVESWTLGALVGIWGLTFFFISRFPISEWSLLGLFPALAFTIFLVFTRGARVIELGKERKKRLDESRQFYSSPEWQQVRKEVVREYGVVCTECGIHIENSIDVTVDHIRPRSKYPHLALEKQNLRVLCRSCNSSKGASDSEILFQ